MIDNFQTKLLNDAVEVDIPDRPKTPQAPEPPLHREQPTLPPPLPFPFFPPFPSAPGLIPHPMFTRFPLSLGRGGPGGPHPAMPNLPLPPRFLNPPIKPEDFALPKIKPVEREKPPIPPPSIELTSSSVHQGENERAENREKVDSKFTKMFKPSKELPFMKVPERVPPSVGASPPIVSAPVAPITLATPVPVAQIPPSKNLKTEKTEKSEMVNSVRDYVRDIQVFCLYYFFNCIYGKKNNLLRVRKKYGIDKVAQN